MIVVIINTAFNILYCTMKLFVLCIGKVYNPAKLKEK